MIVSTYHLSKPQSLTLEERGGILSAILHISHCLHACPVQMAAMARFFFDSRDGSNLVRDDEGLELDGMEAAKLAATRGLGDWARDAIPGAVNRSLAIEVRDDAGNQVFRAALLFETSLPMGRG